MRKIFLLRYDTEADEPERMSGFLETVVGMHRAESIPVTLFCKGRSLEGRREQFDEFAAAIEGDALFDVQDHSYSHIGLGYEAGKDVATLRADYERSFAAHEAVFGSRPVGISICGTGGADGKRLRGFDETDKSRAEFEMVASLGVRMINTHLVGRSESQQFADYGSLGHPEIMGFPSGYSDTSWMRGKPPAEALAYTLAEIDRRAAAGEHMPLMLHDWVAWEHAGDRELTHVKTIADRARSLGYELATHAACLADESLWRGAPAGPSPVQLSPANAQHLDVCGWREAGTHSLHPRLSGCSFSKRGLEHADETANRELQAAEHGC